MMEEPEVVKGPFGQAAFVSPMRLASENRGFIIFAVLDEGARPLGATKMMEEEETAARHTPRCLLSKSATAMGFLSVGL